MLYAIVKASCPVAFISEQRHSAKKRKVTSSDFCTLALCKYRRHPSCSKLTTLTKNALYQNRANFSNVQHTLYPCQAGHNFSS